MFGLGVEVPLLLVTACWISSCKIGSSLKVESGRGGTGSQVGRTNSLGSELYDMLKKDSASLALKAGLMLGLSSSKSCAAKRQNDFAHDLRALTASRLALLL